MAVSAAVAAVAVSAVSTVASIDAAKDQKKAAEEQSAQQRASNQAEQIRSRRENLRRQRIQQSQVEAAGAVQGSSGSSANLAVSDAIGGTTANAMATTSGQVLAANNLAATQQAQYDAQARQQTFQAIGGLASSIGGMALSTPAGQKGVADLFSAGTSASPSRVGDARSYGGARF